MMWLVTIDIAPKINDFRPNFFPRRVRYQSQAVELQREVAQKGGKASIKKEEKPSK